MIAYVPDSYDKDWLAGRGGFPEEGFNPGHPSYETRMAWRKAQGQVRANDPLSAKVIYIVIAIIVGALTLLFAGGWGGLLSSRP